jgi:hypothetical protein
MTRNKQTPLKDEQLNDFDDLYQKLDDIMKAIQKLADQKNPVGEQQNDTLAECNAVTTENFTTCFRKGYQGLRNGYVTEKKGLLLDQDLENIGEKFKTKYDEFTEDLITKGNENRDAEKKRLAEVYTAHEIGTMKQMEGWASEYSEPVRRWMRWIGKHLFDDDEPKETVHEALKVIGDCMMAAGFRPKTEPATELTFRAVLLYKWCKVKPWLVRRKLWCYYLFFFLGFVALLCFGIYHNRVMQMDKTNRIFYKTVIQTRRDAEIWQDIDSIVKGIKQHHELQADPPKKK